MKEIVLRVPRVQWSLFWSWQFISGLFVLGVVGGVVWWYQAIRPYLWIDGAYVEAYSAIVSSDGGRIVEMGPQEGDRVQLGQTLVILDRDFLLSQRTQTKESLFSLQKQMEIEKAKMEKALQDYLSAVAELEGEIGSEEKVNQQLRQMEEAQDKSRALSSQFAAAQTALSEIDKKMSLTAPFDGVVLKRAQNPGAMAAFGEPIYVLCDPAQVWIEAEIPEEEIGRVKVGTQARIQLAAYPGQEWRGIVTWQGPATVAKRSFLPVMGQKEKVPVRISFEGSASFLKPGLSAQVGLKVR